MTSTTSTKCLDEYVLRNLANGNCSASELTLCEEHVSHCEHCRALLDSQALDATWHDQLLPAFKTEPEFDSHTTLLDMAYQSVLNLLGPTDNPHMLGRIGSYEVLAIVGSGGMGVVFKAFDAALNRFVAIKMMQPHLATLGAARQRFEREGRAAAAVINDFVLPIYAVSEWQGVPYLVMQYSAGMNLQKRLETEGPLKLSEILRIGMQVSRGLAAAHAQGLVHRDVKPSNVLLDGSVDRAMLTDFGLARAADDASVTRTGLLAGTPQYMSPEQVRGDRCDRRSDLFSLGATIYAMCTGHSPFRGESSYAVLHRIINDTPRCLRDVNADVPEWLDQIVMKLLSKSSEDRFDSAEQVADLLEGCLAHVQQPTATPLPTALSTKSSPRNRRPRIVMLLAVAAFCLFVLAGVVFKLEWDKGTLIIECDTDDVPIRILQGDKVVESLTVSSQGKSTRIAAGVYTVEIDHAFDEATIQDGLVTITRGNRQVVKVKSENKTNTSNSSAVDKPADDVDVQVVRDPETGVIQIRSKSRDKAERAAAVLNKINDLATQIAVNPFQKLFDAIAVASNEINPTPVPTKLLIDCFTAPSNPAGTKLIGTKPQDYPATFLLKSIHNASRTVEPGGRTVYEFDVDALTFIEEVTTLLSGDKTVASEILNGLSQDPKGPRVDLKKIVKENLDKRVKLTCKFHADGSMEHLVEIAIRDQATFMPVFQRLFESEPGYLANGTKDFYVLTRTPSTPDAKPQRLGGAIVNHKFIWGTLDMVEALRE